MSFDTPQLVTVANVRDMRYGEIFIIKQTGLEVYNTTGLNDCPAELWDKLDLEAIKQEHGAMAVQKNGPHFWMMDWQELALGETATFGGIDARWAAKAPLSVVQQGSSGAAPYTIYTPCEETEDALRRGQANLRAHRPGGQRLRPAGSRRAVSRSTRWRASATS